MFNNNNIILHGENSTYIYFIFFNRLLDFIAHKTYYEELQNNYKTITKVKKTELFWEFSTGSWL